MPVPSMFTRRNAIWLIPLALALTYPLWHIPVAAFLAPRGGFDPNYGKDEKSDRESYDFRLEMPVIYEYKDGKQSAVIRAQAGYSTPKPGEYALDAVDADTFSVQGDLTHIVAKKGVFQDGEKLLTLIGDVVIDKRADNQRLYSDLLYYDDNKRTVTCPGPTRLTGDGIQVTGANFFYDLQTGRSEVGGRVNCLIDKQGNL